MNKQSGNIIIALLIALGTITIGIGVMNTQTSQKQNETSKRKESYEELLASRNAMEIAAYI